MCTCASSVSLLLLTAPCLPASWPSSISHAILVLICIHTHSHTRRDTMSGPLAMRLGLNASRFLNASRGIATQSERQAVYSSSNQPSHQQHHTHVAVMGSVAACSVCGSARTHTSLSPCADPACPIPTHTCRLSDERHPGRCAGESGSGCVWSSVFECSRPVHTRTTYSSVCSFPSHHPLTRCVYVRSAQASEASSPAIGQQQSLLQPSLRVSFDEDEHIQTRTHIRTHSIHVETD